MVYHIAPPPPPPPLPSQPSHPVDPVDLRDWEDNGVDPDTPDSPTHADGIDIAFAALCRDLAGFNAEEFDTALKDLPLQEPAAKLQRV